MVREKERGALLVEELELLAPQGEDAAEDERLDLVSVRLSVGDGEGRTPGAAEDDPAINLCYNAFKIFN